MAKARALDKRRKSIRNIRKITRTMELIATARYRKSMDRALAANDFTNRMTQVVTELSGSTAEVEHPLLEVREFPRKCVLLVLTANRGLCGGYNASVIREAVHAYESLLAIPERERQAEKAGPAEPVDIRLEVAGKRGIGAMRYRGIEMAETYLQFNDRPEYDEVDSIASRYLDGYLSGAIDRVDVVYTRFHNVGRQEAVTETLLPLAGLGSESPSDRAGGEKGEAGADGGATTRGASASEESIYEYVPSAESILDEIVPMSFRVKLFKCFLDAAVSEQVARMIAMKSATENADDMIKRLTMTYNRARQSSITNEIMEVIGGSEALSK